ncbi:MAG: ferritin [Spirochaetes bacterium DG_61]|jgi:ferritin|nr:MAG: ferritin [Spirochaetes bacterium DG_61]
MINSKIEKAINDQINAELYSSYLYLSMATYFESIHLSGFARWMQVQSQEEMKHAMKFYGYVFEKGGRVTLKAIDAPPTEWKSPLDTFESVYNHEVKVTGLINKLVELARAENDIATENFLMWFIAEQVEEEASADQVVQRLKLIKESTQGLFMLDRELGQREG